MFTVTVNSPEFLCKVTGDDLHKLLEQISGMTQHLAEKPAHQKWTDYIKSLVEKYDRAEIAAMCGVSSPTVCSWIKGESEPRDPELIKARVGMLRPAIDKAKNNCVTRFDTRLKVW